MDQCWQLTPEEQARITELQELLIDRFIEYSEALEDGEQIRAAKLQAEIDALLREAEEMEKWLR
jgi:hypothetical protein